MRAAGVSVAALGMAALVAAAGCSRTEDGSYVMKRPSLSRLFSFRSDEPAPAAIVRSKTMPRQASQPLPTTLAVNRVKPRVPKVTLPSVKIARNPPFKRADPAKPLSCKNSKTATGRIQVVCT